jgi:hypothetical protein
VVQLTADVQAAPNKVTVNALAQWQDNNVFTATDEGCLKVQCVHYSTSACSTVLQHVDTAALTDTSSMILWQCRVHCSGCSIATVGEQSTASAVQPAALP